MSNATETHSWPELAIGLYDKLTGRGAQINYEFEDFEILIPSSTAAEAKHARWKMNGKLSISTRNDASSQT